jgi:hypothetical protein
VGAHLGCDAIPARLRKQVLYAEHLVETADRLYAARHEPSPAPALASARSRSR